MAVRVGAVGSLTRSDVILLQEDGAYIDCNEMYGIHWRAQPFAALSSHVMNLVDSVTRRHGQTTWGSWGRCSALAIAMSGVDSTYPDPVLELLAYSLGPEAVPLIQVSVVEAGHWGALLGAPGIVVRCGIGCAVFGMNSNGKTHLTNPVSSLIGVPGSGYSIGQEVVWVLQKGDDGRATPEEKMFCDSVVATLPDASFRAFFRRIDDARRVGGFHFLMHHVYALAETCGILAERGDPVAGRILNHAVQELVLGVATVSDVLRLESDDEIPLVFRGGMARTCYPLCSRITALLKDVRPGLRFLVERGRYSPIIGAALFALAGARTMPKDAVLAKLLDTLPQRTEAPFLYADSYFGP